MSKTGTTAVQSMLHQQGDLLREKGFIYPAFGRKNGTVSCHHEFTRILKTSTQKSDFTGLFREIEESGCDSAIISSELLEGLQKKHWEKLKKYLDDYDISVIVYLRRQDLAIISMYNELVKKHACTQPFHEYVSSTPRIGKLDYHKYLVALKTVFRGNSILVKAYDPKKLIGGDIKSDFLSSLGLSSLPVTTQASKNTSLSSATAFVMSQINSATQFDVDHRQDYRLATRLSGVLDRHFSSNLGGGDYSYFQSDEDRIKFLNRFSLSNKRVAEEFCDARVLFSDLSEPRQELPVFSDEDMHRYLDQGLACLMQRLPKDATIESKSRLIGAIWTALLETEKCQQGRES